MPLNLRHPPDSGTGASVLAAQGSTEGAFNPKNLSNFPKGPITYHYH